MTRPDRIPDPRQKIGYWVGQTHSFSFIPRSLPLFGRTCRNAYYSDQFSVVSGQQTQPVIQLVASLSTKTDD
jgi:hypothetical protein